MSDQTGSANMSEQLAIELDLAASIESWRASVTNTAKFTDLSLVATATLIASSSRRDFKLHGDLEQRKELSDLNVEIYFSRRRPAESTRVDWANREEELFRSMRPKEPIGSFWYPKPDKSTYLHSPDIFIEVGLESEQFDDLWSRHRNGRRKPAEVKLYLPEVKCTVLESKPVLRLQLGNDKAVVSRVSWSADERPSRSYLDFDHPRHSAVARMISKIDWKYHGWYFQHQQFREIVAQLIASAILAVRNGTGVFSRLDDACYHAENLARELYDRLAEGERLTIQAKKGLKQKKRRRQAQLNVPWKKKVPKTDLEEGLDSWSWSSITKDDLETVCQNYISANFYSSTLEWVLVDALVYAETRDFGEAIKQASPALGGPFLGAYESSAGNVNRMLLKSIPRRLGWFLFKAFFWAGLPAYYAYQRWLEGDTDRAWMIIAGVITFAILWPRFNRWLGYDPRAKYETAKKQVDLHEKMVSAYCAIDVQRPPMIALKMLQDTAKDGAVWDADVWTLMVRAEQRDPASWRHYKHDDYNDLSRSIEHALYRAVIDRDKEGYKIPQPVFDHPRIMRLDFQLEEEMAEKENQTS